MTIIKCPKCGLEIQINISNAVDEYGEEFKCYHCKYQFRYAPNG